MEGVKLRAMQRSADVERTNTVNSLMRTLVVSAFFTPPSAVSSLLVRVDGPCGYSVASYRFRKSRPSQQAE